MGFGDDPELRVPRLAIEWLPGYTGKSIFTPILKGLISMDSYHRQPHRKEQPDGRDCRFCAAVDPNFAKRNPIDRWVHGPLEDSATSHMSENGHVFHLMFEIASKRGHRPPLGDLPKSA
jgi:hypothetical protein